MIRGKVRPGRVLGVVVALLVFVPASMAEVAVTRNDDSVSLHVLGIIVDDPEPVGSAWLAYGAMTDHRLSLNPEGFANGDGRPSILRSPMSPDPAVVWARSSPAGYDIVLGTFTDGAWSDPVPLADSPADELDPVLVQSPDDGTVHLLYWVHDTAPRVVHRQAPADLSSWSTPVQISQPGEIACRPAAAIHDGRLHVAYEVHGLGFGATPRQIVLAEPSGPGFATTTLAVTDHAPANRVGLHGAAGKLWADWIDAAGEMSWRVLQAPGQWTPVQVEPFTSAEDRDFHVRGRIRSHVLE